MSYRPAKGTPPYVARLGGVLAGLGDVGSPFVLLVTGSRQAEAGIWGQVITDCLLEIDAWLDRVPFTVDGRPARRVKVLRNGGGEGIDTLAQMRGKRLGWQPDRMPADWSHWGRRSGIIRNGQMVDKHPTPDLCLAFFAEYSRGTADCAGQARAAGIPTVTVTVEDLYLPHVR